MKAALSIDFGNSYTKVGIRRGPSEKSEPLSSKSDLKFDGHGICIPTVAARSINNGIETWLFGTEVKSGLNKKTTKVFRNWKPRFFRGQETNLDDSSPREDVNSKFVMFSNDQLETLLAPGILSPEKHREVTAILERRRSVTAEPDQDFDYEKIGREYFRWLKRFVEPFCKTYGIGTVGEIPVRITLPSFGANTAHSRLTLETILKEAGWQPSVRNAALPEPVANLIGTFSEGRNFVWRPKGSTLSYSLQPMIGESALFKASRSRALGSGNSRPPIYWVMVADLGGYTTDFAMVGIDLDNVEIKMQGEHEGKKLLGDYSEPIGVHDLDKQIREVLMTANRKAFDTLAADVDGLRIDRFHQEVYQRLRPYNTGEGVIGGTETEKKDIQNVIREFAEKVAHFAERFMLIEQYDQIDELILTGGGCNIPIVRDAVLQKLQKYNLRKSHIPLPDGIGLPHNCRELNTLLVRGATALGATSVFFDYD